MEEKNKNINPDYTSNFADLIAAEEAYLEKRREVNKITEEEAEEKWGICFSSGGRCSRSNGRNSRRIEIPRSE